jgi:PKD repeat protein
VFNISPAKVGITQLPTWFSLGGVGNTVTVTARVNGYTVVATAIPLEYEWNFGDGSGATTFVPGTTSEPAVVHTYRDKATYTITLSVVYSGSFSYVGPAGPQVVQLGQYWAPASTSYEVQEVRSVLVPPGEG